MTDAQKIERLRNALTRLLAFSLRGLSKVEKAAAEQEAKQALEDTKP